MRLRGIRRNIGILEDQDFGIGLYNKGELQDMLRKTEKFTISNIRDGSLSEKCGGVEYTISAAMANHIMKIHKGPKKNKQEVLCQYVNEQLGLKGRCVKVLIDLDKL